MKKILTLFFAVIWMFTTGFQHKHTDFAGTWKLDVKKSKGLPKSFAHIDSFSMDVNQTADSMVTVTSFAGDGVSMKLPPTTIKFDGTEIFREDTTRGSKRWIKASWTTTGEKLIVDNRVEQRRGPSTQKYTETDVWEFGKRGMLMILVTQKFEGGDSTHTEQRYFSKKK